MPPVLVRPRILIILSAAAFLMADAAIVYIALHGDFAFDFTCCYQQAGQHLMDNRSTLYAWTDSYTFRYSPWAALAFTPLALLTAGQAVWVWFGLKVAVMAGLAGWLSAPWHGTERIWVAAAVLLFPPLWHDLVLGNVSVFTVIVLLALLRRPRPGSGALLGLLLLLAPKPHLVPLALWLAVRRPRDAAAALVVLIAGFATGVVAFGADTWVAYVRTFAEPLSRTFTANIGFSNLFGPPGVIVGAVLAVLVLALALRRSGAMGLGLSITSGVILGPYTFIHYISGLLVAAEPILRTRPMRLAVFPWLLLVFPLMPAWLLAFAGVQVATPGETVTDTRAT